MQITTQHGATVLCVEGLQSHFAATRQLYKSGMYEVISATGSASALAVLNAIKRINATVLDAEILENPIHIAATINAVRPLMPQIIIAPPPKIAPPELLNVTYIESVLSLNEELRRLLASTIAQLRADLQTSAALRTEMHHNRQEAQRLRIEAALLRKKSAQRRRS